MPQPSRARRRGFTLVELLVVISILGFLMVLVVPAVVRARSAARNAAIKKEIDLLHQAMMTYATKYGAFPPGNAPNIIVGGAVTTTNDATKHLERLFPRLKGNIGTQVAALTHRNEFLTSAGTIPACAAITPGTALTLWLYGYAPTTTTLNRTLGIMPVVSGGTSAPVLSSGSVTIPGTSGTNAIAPRVKFYDFDLVRVTGTRTMIAGSPTNYGAYCPPRCPNSPYVYIDSANYGSVSSPATYAVVTNAATTDYAAVVDTRTGTFFNRDTFQILCAGQDGEWGTDDDLSNFWKGTRRQFQESNP